MYASTPVFHGAMQHHTPVQCSMGQLLSAAQDLCDMSDRAGCGSDGAASEAAGKKQQQKQQQQESTVITPCLSGHLYLAQQPLVPPGARKHTVCASILMA